MRKVLSFVLVLTLVLSSFSMAFAADTTKAATGLTDVKGIANEDAIQVNYDLGIVTGNPDGTFAPTKAVNRAEFAAMITRGLNIPASALAGYTATSFKDTAGYAWAVPYLAFCQSKGILLGDGAGNVMPGKTITVNEAMTMALRAIGYTANSSLLVGAWPANYVSIAQNNDMYDDVATTTTVDKASAAQIIYNLLTVQKVAVNTDGTTDYQWKGKQTDNKQANLLNTNLNCTENDNVVLGSANYDYDNAKINITGKIGAYGDAYLNDDGDIIAFNIHDSVQLTGKVNDDKDKFEVGDVEYDFGTNDYTTSVALQNATVISTTMSGTKVTAGAIKDFAAGKADGGDYVTINADVSGKKIKNIYSVCAWAATGKELAASDVQSDITDKELLGSDFAQTDDKTIDMNSFELIGVASLDKIAKDNVVFVYESKDSDKDIRRVAVGTQTVKGTVDEFTLNNDSPATVDTITIGGKTYDASTVNTSDVDRIDTDSEGTFYLDGYGKIYDFDGTNGTDTYAVVKGYEKGTTFDNVKFKLYTSEDSTKTYYLSEDDATKIDWTTNSALQQVAKYDVTGVAIGALVGYSLDSDGQLDAINASTGALGATSKLKSSKVMNDGSRDYKVDASCVVFTYENSIANTGSYDVGKIADMDADTTLGSAVSQGAFILNDDGDVTAIFVESSLANLANNDVYGVLNKRSSTKDADGDAVYKYTGYVDGAEFNYKTDNTDSDVTRNLGNGLFGVYAITLDSSNTISKIADLDGPASAGKTSKVLNKTWVSASTNCAEVVTALDDDNTVITTANGKYTADDKAKVYLYSKTDKTFTTSKLSSIGKGDTVTLYDTKDDDYDGIATVVIYIEK